jgi:acylglycerol lipase
MANYQFNRQAFDDTRLFFQCWETDQTPKGIVCLVHGLGEHAGRYSQWGDMLNQAGYNLLAYDLRGHGQSGGQRGHVSSFDDYLQDTDLLLGESAERFPGLPNFLYGHSLGGIIVVDYVLRKKPELNGVIVSALSIRTSLQEQRFKVALSKLLGSIMPKGTLSSGLVPATLSRDPDVVKRYINDPLVHYRVSYGWGKSTLETIDWIDKHPDEWTLPVLFMHGEKDALGYPDGSREFAGRITCDCTLKIWPDLFHEIHNEPEKEEVFEFLRNWLDLHAIKK